MTQELNRQRTKLDGLFQKVSALSHDAEMQAHWARYLCVLVSGFLENAVREIFTRYAREKAMPYVANYVENQLDRFQNPNMQRIFEIAGAFNPQWREELQKKTAGELGDSVDSIVNLRHQIAHGGSAGLSFVIMQTYYKNAKKVVEIINEQCQ